MNKALRTCLRTTPRAFRCQLEATNVLGAGSGSGSRCLASSICPARNHTSAFVSVSPSAGAVSANRGGSRGKMGMRMRMGMGEHLRGYSTREGVGVVGEGEEGQGVVEERRVLEVPEGLDARELEIRGLLVDSLDPVALNVKDVSGGCGTMYSIDIKSERFRGLSMLKQQRLVNEVLGGMIKGWHGVMLKTATP